MNRDDMDFKGLARTLSRKKLDNPNDSPQFTRRHYIWLASAMRDILSEFIDPDKTSEHFTIEFNQRYAIERGIEIFADALASENPNFEKQRFLDNVFGDPVNSNPK